jgi:KDO2-lipid IV(A) lauroyltransferase
MFILWLLALLPQRARTALGAVLGELGMWTSAKRRRVVATNIAKCFPELSPADRRRMARQHFRVASATLLSSSLMWWAGDKRIQRLVRFRNREHFDRALASGRSFILLAPHFVALEVGGLFLARERAGVGLYRRSPNALVEWFMVRARLRFGVELFERDGSLMRLVKLMRKGTPFYYLPDRNPGDASYVFAPFFGHPAATIDALGRIAQLTRADVIPCATRLLPGGQGYEIIFRPPMRDFPTGDAVKDATHMNAEVEALVREMPEQYMWTYKRFKLQPDGAPPFYE